MSAGACPACSVWVDDIAEVAQPDSDLARCDSCGGFSGIEKWSTTAWYGDASVGESMATESYAGFCPKCSAYVPDITDLEYKWFFGGRLCCPSCDQYSRQSAWEDAALLSDEFDANIADLAEGSTGDDIFERLDKQEEYPRIFTDSELEDGYAVDD